jgi:hypothetical protein
LIYDPFDRAQDRFSIDYSYVTSMAQKTVLIGVNPCLKDSVLKKQSQFVPGLIGATFYLKGDYDNSIASVTIENKPNSKHALSTVEWANFELNEGFLLVTQKIAAALRASQ